MSQQKEQLTFATNLAKKAGKIMLDYFDSPNLKIECKEDNMPVTIADKKINQLVIDSVTKIYPSHAVNEEKQSTEKVSKYTWVCDPINGTISFTSK